MGVRSISPNYGTVRAVAARGNLSASAGAVTLAVFQSAVHSLAVPAVSRLASAYPDVEVVVLELEPHDSMPSLRRGDVGGGSWRRCASSRPRRRPCGSCWTS